MATLRFSDLYASFRGNEADVIALKDHFSAFLSFILANCFSASFRKDLFLVSNPPHFAQTFEISS